MPRIKQTMPAGIPHGGHHHVHAADLTAPPAQPGKLLRLPLVEDRVAMKKSSIYAGMKNKTFPAPVRLTTGRAVAWRESDILAWCASRMTNADVQQQGGAA